MRVIGVIDLREGRAVHARGGRREAYAPVGTVAGVPVDGDPAALARAYVDVLGVRELYAADLDAIEHDPTAMQTGAIGALAALGVPLWVDAGVSTADQAAAVLSAGASIVIVGLESLTSFDSLVDICSTIGGERAAFSVDLRDGVPVSRPNVVSAASTASEIAARARAAGAGSLIVLDLSRVGTNAGVDVQLMEDCRRAAPGGLLLAGGGVRDDTDLRALARAGCDGALVATALLRGEITGASSG
jgi:phosphoribosylformimino-5-aminoimidazole carboxamide ribotide isomerase